MDNIPFVTKPGTLSRQYTSFTGRNKATPLPSGLSESRFHKVVVYGTFTTLILNLTPEN